VYLLLEHPVLPFESISFLNAYANSHVQPFWPWKVIFHLFVLSSVSVVIYLCRAAFSQKKKEVITKRGCLHLHLRALRQMKAVQSIQLPLLRHRLQLWFLRKL
jgi:hypothetical protein